MSIQVSFIVPVYNVEDYLESCLNSIIEQNNINKEIIIINDGSLDNSLLIAKKFEEKYEYISVINKINEGISVARNVGISHAKGEYICFIDSDDFYYAQFAHEFYLKCKKYNLDIIRGFYNRFDDTTKMFENNKLPEISYTNKVMQGKEFIVNSINQKANEVVVYTGFFKREYILKNNIIFPKGISYEEDQIFYLESLIKDNNCKILQTDLVFYAYRSRSGSTTKTPTFKQIEDIIKVVNMEYNLIKSVKMSLIEQRACYKYSSSSFYQLTSIYGRLDKKSRKIARNIVPISMKIKSIKNSFNRHQRIKIFLFSFFPIVVDFVYYFKFIKNKRCR